MPATADTLQGMLFKLVEATKDTVLIMSSEDCDEAGARIVYANPAFCRAFGYTKKEIIGKPPWVLQGPDTCQSTLNHIATAVKAGDECQEEILLYSKDGVPYWIDMHIVPLCDGEGEAKYVGAMQRNITDKKVALEKLKRLALEDSLTGIGNRAALQKHLESMGRIDGAAEDNPCMLLFDMDGFKHINDTLGHMVGDEILKNFARYIVLSLGPNDFMARLGGDEFVAILKGYPRDAAISFAEHAVANLTSMNVCGAAKVSLSVGVTFFQAGEDMTTVIARADTALYWAKGAGRGTVRVYSPELIDTAMSESPSHGLQTG